MTIGHSKKEKQGKENGFQGKNLYPKWKMT
jgi:hypothetical protein